VEEILALSDRFGHRVVRLYERDDLGSRLADAGIEVVPLGFRARRAGQSWPLAALRLRRIVRRWQPDVLHTALFYGNLVGQLAVLGKGVPVLSTFNRSGEWYSQARRSGGWKARTMFAVGRWADHRGYVHYRAVGEEARRTNCAVRGLDPARCTVVPRGVGPVGSVVPADRSAFGLPESGPLFVNVARRVPEKAQHLLVAAFAKVQASLPDASLAIAGDPGPADAAISAAIATAGLEDAVFLLGYRSDARSLVAAADVFAFSSVSEGSPGSVAEALSLGAPVAAFDIPPVAELTDGGRYAFLAPSGSVDGLADAMMSAYRSPDRAERVEAARRWAERFELSAVADALGDLLETCAGRGEKR
jgi:glycosyltransferase involved in cell wall biosynthesis